MIEYIVKSLKKRKIELDSGQLNLIHKMIESIQPEKDLTSKSVSYTHLRAHET